MGLPAKYYLSVLIVNEDYPRAIQFLVCPINKSYKNLNQVSGYATILS